MLTELITKRYPKDLQLKDGLKVVLRPMVPTDKEELLTFFKVIAEDDRLFLKDDVSKREMIEKWCDSINYESVFPVLAFDGRKLIGDASLHFQFRTWMRHVALVRVVIHPEYRHRGLASIMIEDLMDVAEQTKLEILDAEFMEEQSSAIHTFEKLGFCNLATISDHLIDFDGHSHNLVKLSYNLKKVPARL